MTELSPAAKAVMDAFWAPVHKIGEDVEFDRRQAAAALRAAADVVVPEQQKPGGDIKWRAFVRYEERNSLRSELLAIAAELEAH